MPEVGMQSQTASGKMKFRTIIHLAAAMKYARQVLGMDPPAWLEWPSMLLRKVWIMSIFSSIKDAIFGHKAEAATPAPAIPMDQSAPVAAAPAEPVDVEATCAAMPGGNVPASMLG